MTFTSRWIGAAVLSVSISAVALAQVTPALDVKMGLWEITSTINIGGQMPQMDTSKMTPEQKAQMDAAMKGMMGAHTSVTKSCITKEDFEKSNFMVNEEPGVTCKQVITTNTRSTLDANVTCTGDHTMTTQVHIDASSSTTFKAIMKSANTDQGRTMTMNADMAGKWLGADCGSVK